jgi:Raf kinase inhibitor-like YbhB/YbcL family protein
VMYNSQPGGVPSGLSRHCRDVLLARAGLRRLILGLVILTSALGIASRAPSIAATGAAFSLTSAAVRNGAAMPPLQISNRGGCSGANQSPPLNWAHAPSGTAAFAVTMADLDAKVGVLWHWILFDIPVATTDMAQNADFDPALRPAGSRQAVNSFNVLGYSGPCPPRGSLPHHYLITVWALTQAQMPFKNGEPADAIAIYLRRHAIGHASLTPHYSRH